ncbi:MAG: UDP-N-acetylglucosamine--N-acetylmuramyl-(pentapeptide) pyrophosphoryl-undecaprenol N-acetylglucosamine transferase [Myxococcales bacterium]|nr:UDP-N-acetylglucosamine--N-acetylmuramyl-(pentapeptide) pyrophosphoryl-undecaprenol N-acetylglucosamine transferase [Myxococcales bacterium]
MRTIVLTGGGSAGHVTLNLALLAPLARAGLSPVYIGSVAGIERALVERAGVPYHAIKVGKLRRYRSVQNLIDPLRVAAGVAQASALLRRLAPAAVFSKGGFVAVPVAAAAWLNRIPLVVHESDLTPGLANRLCFPLATRICAAQPETAAAIGRADRVVHTGTPIRPDVLAAERAEGQRRFGLDPTLGTLLVIGGSLGAEAINRVLRETLDRLPGDLQVVHVCGAGNRSSAHEGRPRYQQHEYIDQGYGHLLAAADLVVSRAGANSLAELLALRRPALLIPLPLSASRGDQIDNARKHAQLGFGHVLDEAELTPERLIHELERLRSEAQAMTTRMASEGGADPAETLVTLLEQVARGATR